MGGSCLGEERLLAAEERCSPESLGEMLRGQGPERNRKVFKGRAGGSGGHSPCESHLWGLPFPPPDFGILALKEA